MKSWRTTCVKMFVGILITAGFSACASAPRSIETFCVEAVPLLSQSDIGDDPAALRDQMLSLKESARLIPDDQQQATLVALIDPLIDQLDRAVAGTASSGWSSAEVVDNVGLTCDSDALVSWVVQP